MVYAVQVFTKGITIISALVPNDTCMVQLVTHDHPIGAGVMYLMFLVVVFFFNGFFNEEFI